MNKDVVVTILYKVETFDISLPLTIPIAQLAPIVVNLFNENQREKRQKETELLNESQKEKEQKEPKLVEIPTAPEGMIYVARLISSGAMIEPRQTLEKAQVNDGDTLELLLIAEPQIAVTSTNMKGAQLKFLASKHAFACSGRLITIGRGSKNAINLTGLPHDDVVSGQHAIITQRQNQYWIQDNSSTNGTFVNGVLLEKDSTIQLQHGSQIQFGKDGPELTFYINP